MFFFLFQRKHVWMITCFDAYYIYRMHKSIHIYTVVTLSYFLAFPLMLCPDSYFLGFAMSCISVMSHITIHASYLPIYGSCMSRKLLAPISEEVFYIFNYLVSLELFWLLLYHLANHNITSYTSTESDVSPVE